MLNIIPGFGMTKKGSKKELRLQKKLEKLTKKKEKSVRLSSGIEIQDKYIRSPTKPKLEKKPRSSSAENYKNYYFTWCQTHSDTYGTWSWGENREWSDAEFLQTIQPHLDAHNNDSWNDVESKDYNGRGGYRKLLNKYQPLDSICDDAQLRWCDLEILSEFEELFRLRLGSNRRIWGVRIQHHFYMVWYERNHQICPI